jgi:hypothetical protein
MELAALDPLKGAMVAGQTERSVADISVKQALAPPLMILVAMLMAAAGISSWTQVDGSRVFLPYLETWAASTLIVILFWSFVQVARLAADLADNPLQTLGVRLRQRQRLFVLPAVIFPLFIGAYTWAKCSIPFSVGYGWEARWADLDRLIFGVDPWVLAHALSPPALASAWTFFYAVIWGFALVFSGTLIATFASRRFTATFFTALMLSWLIGGVLMAYAISAAGPVFAHLADPALADRFAPLRAELIHILGEEDLVMKSQRYLAAGMKVKVALKGGGISAMPSMHIATATILIIAARRTRWLPVAALFWAMTFFGSVYLGYHYAVDAPVAAVVAVLCWTVARRIYATRSQSVAGESRETLALS